MDVSDVALSRQVTRVGRHLVRDHRTVATAESCTGGWIAKLLTDNPGSSQYFAEGFVTYSNASKLRQLGVKAATLRDHGAVSEQTVRAMAMGALNRAGTSVAVAVTGIAGPGGATSGKPVGTVWIGWAERRGRRVVVTTELKRFRGDRDAVRRKTVMSALKGLSRARELYARL